MIRRVQSQPGPANLTIAGLPPGTPASGPVRIAYMDPAGVTMWAMPGDALIASDGAPLLQTGPASFGTLRAAGRPL